MYKYFSKDFIKILLRFRKETVVLGGPRRPGADRAAGGGSREHRQVQRELETAQLELAQPGDADHPEDGSLQTSRCGVVRVLWNGRAVFACLRPHAAADSCNISSQLKPRITIDRGAFALAYPFELVGSGVAEQELPSPNCLDPLPLGSQ